MGNQLGARISQPVMRLMTGVEPGSRGTSPPRTAFFAVPYWQACRRRAAVAARPARQLDRTLARSFATRSPSLPARPAGADPIHRGRRPRVGAIPRPNLYPEVDGKSQLAFQLLVLGQYIHPHDLR